MFWAAHLDPYLNGTTVPFDAQVINYLVILLYNIMNNYMSERASKQKN